MIGWEDPGNQFQKSKRRRLMIIFQVLHSFQSDAHIVKVRTTNAIQAGPQLDIIYARIVGCVLSQ